MGEERKYKAKVDGKEVDVEVLEGEIREEKPSEEGQMFSRWRSISPFLVTGVVVAGIILLSITLFIWALPFLIPLCIVFFIVRFLNQK